MRPDLEMLRDSFGEKDASNASFTKNSDAGSTVGDAGQNPSVRPEKPAAPHSCDDGDGGYDHDWEFISDWYGDPSIPNGTKDCSFARCKACGHESQDAKRDDYDDSEDEYKS